MARWEDIWTDVSDEPRSRESEDRHGTDHATSDRNATDHVAPMERVHVRRRDPSLTPREEDVRASVYAGIERIEFDGRHVRRDRGS